MTAVPMGKPKYPVTKPRCSYPKFPCNNPSFRTYVDVLGELRSICGASGHAMAILAAYPPRPI